MKNKSQEGGFKWNGRYFIFYSSRDRIEKRNNSDELEKKINNAIYEDEHPIQYGLTTGLKNFVKKKTSFLQTYIENENDFIDNFQRLKYKPDFTDFKTKLSLDNILSIFYKGVYMKNNTSKIYFNAFNTTIYNNFLKLFFNDDYIIKEVLKQINTNDHLFLMYQNLNQKIKNNYNKISDNEKIKIKNLAKKLENLIVFSNVKYENGKENEIKKNNINFIKKIIDIYQKKKLNNNELLEILLNDDYEVTRKIETTRPIIFNCNTKKCFKLNYFTKIQNQNTGNIDKNAIKIINFLRETYKVDINSYFIINVNITSNNEIIYNKIFKDEEIYKLVPNSLSNKFNKNLQTRIINKIKKIKDSNNKKFEDSVLFPINTITYLLLFVIIVIGIIVAGIIVFVLKVIICICGGGSHPPWAQNIRDNY